MAERKDKNELKQLVKSHAEHAGNMSDRHAITSVALAIVYLGDKLVEAARILASKNPDFIED